MDEYNPSESFRPGTACELFPRLGTLSLNGTFSTRDARIRTADSLVRTPRKQSVLSRILPYETTSRKC
jgi:hypothetical protein